MSCRLLQTERLILRQPEASDISAMVALAGDYDVAKNLSRMPHPYTHDDAKAFIAATAERHSKGTDFGFVVTRKDDGALMGGCGLHPGEGGLFEMGYWLGRPYWGQGFATEAGRGLCAFAFARFRAQAVMAGWFIDNPASGHVLEKLGFVPAGLSLRDCAARGARIFCHDMLLERAEAKAACHAEMLTS